jgi:hypothetical protein
MNDLIQLLQDNSAIGQELIDCLDTTQTSAYYEKFGTKKEKQDDVNKLLDEIRNNQKDRIEIIDLLIKKLNYDKKQLLKKL